ncbi:UNVERIFIED_CONTAM: hypothetical protein NCL1_20380 [Trichonephila clavipes]
MTINNVRFNIKAGRVGNWIKTINLINTHKNTSWPNNPSKCSIGLSIYNKSYSHGRKQQENIVYNFPKRKRDRVKHTFKIKIANERLK